MIDYTILVPASPSNDVRLNNLIRSHTKYKNEFTPDPVVFGQLKPTSCYTTKMAHMYNMLTNRFGRNVTSEFVVVLDAFDLIFNKGLDEALFQDFKENPNLEFLFGSETNCFPYTQYQELFESHARSRTLKYLNCGATIARREPYIRVLEEFLNPDKYDQREWLRNSDQAACTLLYKNSLVAQDNKVLIDCEARVSLQMFGMEYDKNYSLDTDKQLTFFESGNTPYFVHFNGDSKEQMHHFDMEYGK